MVGVFAWVGEVGMMDAIRYLGEMCRGLAMGFMLIGGEYL